MARKKKQGVKQKSNKALKTTERKTKSVSESDLKKIRIRKITDKLNEIKIGTKTTLWNLVIGRYDTDDFYVDEFGNHLKIKNIVPLIYDYIY